MGSVDISKIIPSSLRDQFWLDLTDSVSEELNLYIETLVLPKEDLFYIRNQNNIDQLIEICKSFGFIPDRSVDESIEFLKREVKAMLYRVENKSTINGFLFPIKTINREGIVYNIEYTGSKLIKTPDYETIVLNLDSQIFFEVFTGFVNKIFFTSDNQNIVNLDDNRFLDDGWSLDENNIVVSHIAVEYIIDRIIVDGVNHLMTKKYMDYLNYNVQYNRKISTLAHTGCHLNILMDSSGFYDNISMDVYTIPDLELNATITNKLKDTNNQLLILDNSDDMDLDKPSLAFLDNDAGVVELTANQTFCEIVAGTGTKSLVSYNYPEINNNTIGLWDFNEISGSAKDYSGNNINLDFFGGASREEEIFEKSLLLNGVNSYVQSITNINITFTDISFTFWLKGIKAEQNFTNNTLAKFGSLLLIEYNESIDEIEVTIDDGVTIYNMSGAIIMDGTEYNIFVDIDITNTIGRLVINDVELDTVSLVGVSDYSGGYDLIIGYDGVTNYYNGNIDEFRIYNSIFSSGTKSYYYTNQISNLSILSNEVYRETLDPFEVYDDEDYFIIHGKVLGNTVKNELLIESDGIQTNVIGTVVYQNIKKVFFEIAYTNSGENIVAGSDELGNILGESTNGVIDYITGSYNVDFFRDYTQTDEIIFSGSTSSISITLENAQVLINTFSVTYFIGSTELTGSDDGAGNITGTSISSGTINYVTGEVDITFSSPTDAVDITSTYNYRKSSTPDLDTKVYANYSILDDLPITEVGLVNVDNELVAYSTFPPVILGNNLYHLYNHFCIKK